MGWGDSPQKSATLMDPQTTDYELIDIFKGIGVFGSYKNNKTVVQTMASISTELNNQRILVDK